VSSGYPPSVAAVNQTAPAPRRVRGIVAGRTIFDTTRALYVWEWPHYPQYYIARDDADMTCLALTGVVESTPQGAVQLYDLRVGSVRRERAVRSIVDSPIPGLAETLRFEWDALEQWFEEDEEVFVHPRNPYSRVDALRSNRNVRIELDGVTLAEASTSVMVFETGLPTRYYIDQRNVRFESLVSSETRTECPYKGRTSSYWSVEVAGKIVPDVAWSYAFPTRQLLPIAGLVAFLNEKVDVVLDGVPQPRPNTHMG